MKINFILPVLMINLLFANVWAQDFCGTEMLPAYEQHLLTKDRSHLYRADHARSSLLVPVQYHIIGQSNGVGYFTTSELVSLHCSLNEAFTRADIQFYFDDEPHYINNSSYYNFQDFNSGSAMMNEHNIADVCNIYIVENPAGVCGYAYFPNSGPNGGGIVLSKDCSSYKSTTLAHEMGHYLGLPHTFSNLGAGIEYVNGTNCSNAGDLYCDTPADFLDYRWSCPYTGSETDPNGDLYSSVIDQSLYMSYSLDECQLRFSLMQEADMYQTLQTERPYLLNHADAPQDISLDPIEVMKKAESAFLMPANQALFSWNSTEGAFMYHFQLTHFALSFNYDYDILVTDTSLFFTDLLVNTNYKWRVKPISRINTCMPFSDYQYLKTSSTKMSFDKTTPACFGNTDGSIEAIPVNGTPPFTFEWSNGATYNPINSLPGGVYQVTVTDGQNQKISLTVDLPEPAPLEVDIDLNSSGSAIASASGGTPPYTFQWGNGTMGAVNNAVQQGTLVAYVSDANGCVSSKIIVIASSNDPAIPEGGLHVYPNPVKQNNQVIIHITGFRQVTGTFALYSTGGQMIYSTEEDLVPGEQKIALSTRELSDGVYILKVVSPDHRYIERLVVTK